MARMSPARRRLLWFVGLYVVSLCAFGLAVQVLKGLLPR